MANQNHLDILDQGVSVWNGWRKGNEAVIPDLSEAFLLHRDLRGILLNGAKLHGCQLNGAILDGADLTGADLSEAVLGMVSLKNAILTDTNCSKAILSYTCLQDAVFIRTDLRGANLSNSAIYDTLIWGIQIDADTIQTDIAVTDNDANMWIQVDSLMTAQLINLMFDKMYLFDQLNVSINKTLAIIGNFVGEHYGLEEELPKIVRAFQYSSIIVDAANFKENVHNFFKITAVVARLAEYIIIDITKMGQMIQQLDVILSATPLAKIQVIIDQQYYDPSILTAISSYKWAKSLYRYNRPNFTYTGGQ